MLSVTRLCQPQSYWPVFTSKMSHFLYLLNEYATPLYEVEVMGNQFSSEQEFIFLHVAFPALPSSFGIIDNSDCMQNLSVTKILQRI